MASKAGTKRRGRSAKPRVKEEQAPPPKAGDADLPRALPPLIAAGLVFVAAGSVLVLEILAIRLLAPYVGTTLETTTSIIGAALGGIAAGAAIGGRLADRTNTRQLVVGLLLAGGIFALLTVPAVRWLGPGARDQGTLSAIGITFIALVPAATVLSAVSPAVAHLQLHDLRASGTVVGRLSAWATAGALIGTFGTGFVLVPLMPVSTAVLLIAAVLIAVGIVLGTTSELLPPAGIAGVVLVAVALGAGSTALSSPCVAETRYHCIGVVREASEPGGYNLLLDDGFQSFVDPNDPTRLEYVYSKWVADVINAMEGPQAPIKDVVIGGGGFTVPRWINATHPGSESLVLELDGGVVDWLEDRLKVPPPPEFRVDVGDARITMRDVESDSVDVVVGDAYNNHSVPWQLTTAEWTDEVKRVLKPGGLYVINVIDFPPLELLKAEGATLLDAFADVRITTFMGEDRLPFGGNAILFASDRPMAKAVRSNAEGALTYDRPRLEQFVGDAEPLRDDYAPADQLLTRPD
jgi:Methyltransferase domain